MARQHWIITSTHQIKPGVLKKLHGAKGPRGKRGPKGAKGATGPTGAMGPQGPAGSAATVSLTDVDSPTLTLAPGQTTFDVDPSGFEADCPAGDAVYGTGFDSGGVGRPGFALAYGSFVGGFIYNDSSVTIQVSVQAICGPAAGATSNARARSAAGTRYQQDVKRAAAAH